MPEILSAKPIINQEVSMLKKRVSKLGEPPLLKVILVGSNSESLLYVNNKVAFCKRINVKCEIVNVEESISKEGFVKLVSKEAQSTKVTGLLVQLPLPNQLKEIEYNKLIPPEKDVDGFTDKNIFSLYINKNQDVDYYHIPCTPSGILKLADYYGIKFSGKKVTIIGRSLIVGKPLSLLLTNKNATVTLCHSKTKDLELITKSSDIIITAIGLPNFLEPKHLSDHHNQIVIDVGINRLNKKTVGDVNYELVKNKVKSITPVPGGVGPMTVLSLANNLVRAAEYLCSHSSGKEK